MSASSRQITIAPGLTNIVLPNGRRCKGGDVVILSDEEYATISAAARAAIFSSDIALPG